MYRELSIGCRASTLLSDGNITIVPRACPTSRDPAESRLLAATLASHPHWFASAASPLATAHLRRSGNQVFEGEPSQVVKPLRQTSEDGLPVLPPGGVTPPDPEKYGTLAARWVYSHRNV